MGFRRLRTKIILAFCALMIVGGTVTTSLVQFHISRTLAQVAEESGWLLARRLSVALEPPLEQGDREAARRILIDRWSGHRDIAHLFIAQTGRVIAHGFSGTVPAGINELVSSERPTTSGARSAKIMDLPSPIAGGRLGTVHVGVALGPAAAATNAVVRNVLAVTVIAMIAGILGILALSSVMTRPVQRLTDVAKRMGQGDLAAVAPVLGRDELAELAVTFNEMARQIRERVAESERLREYYERILDHLPSGVVVCAPDGRIEYANRVVREGGGTTGLRCHESGIGQGGCADCAIGAAFSSDCVLHREHTTDSGRAYEVTCIPFVPHTGTRSMIVISLDVTEKQQLAQRLQRAERLAIAGEVAAGVVHALNNPLDGVRRALALAARDPGNPPRTGSMLGLAAEGVERIINVTTTLLNLARADETGEKTNIEPNSVVGETIRFVQLKADERGVSLRADLDPGLGVIVAEPRGLNEALVNLLLNSLDATPPGGEIVVGTRRLAADLVEFSVSDNGVGIAPEHLDAIFEPFFTTKAVGQGTGLGLAVVRRTVEAHGGEITVQSRPGQGATFRIRMPIEPAPREERSVAAS